jgi:Asp-tRNA(Asn)/Glu-tRNA(Gln) amidotransferase A subunit family amidase
VTDPLCYPTATETIIRFRAGEVSPVELVQAVIERADSLEPTIDAFAETFPDAALAATREAEDRYRQGTARPLEGIPGAVKEEAPIAGQRNTLGSLALRDEVADETAVFAQRILDAGGIVHARTTTPELPSAPVTGSPLRGVTRNHWTRRSARAGRVAAARRRWRPVRRPLRPGRTSGGRSGSRPRSAPSLAVTRHHHGTTLPPRAWDHLVPVRAGRHESTSAWSSALRSPSCAPPAETS